jgi:nucleoside diphosphate kinase
LKQNFFVSNESVSIKIELQGKNALSKLKNVLGQRDGTTKNTLRANYGKNRENNFFFNSETIEEYSIEQSVIFRQIELK